VCVRCSRKPISLKKQSKELTNEELNINHASSIKNITYNKIDASSKRSSSNQYVSVSGRGDQERQWPEPI
jgi:hypothetical protein